MYGITAAAVSASKGWNMAPLNTKSDRFELDILKFNFVVDANVYYL